MILQKIRKGNIAAILALAMLLPLLTGCVPSRDTDKSQLSATGDTGASQDPTATETVAETTVPTEPAPTTPADGDPNDVTCLGSYTVEDPSAFADSVVAYLNIYETEPAPEEIPEDAAGTTEEATESTEAATEPSTEPVDNSNKVPIDTLELTNRQLQVYYWMEVLAYKHADHAIAPDFSQSLDTQICEIDDTVGSWQQYFLREALNTWAETQTLVLWGELEGIPLDEAYLIRDDLHEKHLSQDLPATKYLYGYNGTTYVPNTLHQEFLDNIPTMLKTLAVENGYATVDELAQSLAGTDADTLAEYVELYNRGYMFFTELTYHVEDATAEEVEAYFTEHEAEYAAQGITRDSGKTVDMRHILLIPDGAEIAADGTVTATDKAWKELENTAANLTAKIRKTYPYTEGTFATFAANNSMDPGSAMNGGSYVNIRKGQMLEELDAWLFDEARVAGDKETIRTACGLHLVYFSGSTDDWYAAAEEDLMTQRYQQISATAMDRCSLEVDYSAIALGSAAYISNSISPDSLLYADIAHERYPEPPLYLQQDYQNTKYGSFSLATYGCGITTFAMLATYLADEYYNVPLMCSWYGRYCTEKGTDRSLLHYESGDLGMYLKEQVYDLNVVFDALREGCMVINLQHESYWTRGGHFLLLSKINENDTIVVRDSNIYNYSKLSGHEIDEHEQKTFRGGNVTNWIFWPKYVSCSQCVRCDDGTSEDAPDILFNTTYQCGKCDTALLRRNAYLN